MPEEIKPIAINASDVPPRSKRSLYPQNFASLMVGREKRQLGEFFGIENFGVNLTSLAPNGISSLRHTHSKQDEFIYVLHGNPTLKTNEGRSQLLPGMFAGFKAGSGNAHCLINETSEEVVYLEIGDRTKGDEVTYPDDDIQAVLEEGRWHFTHKNGAPY